MIINRAESFHPVVRIVSYCVKNCEREGCCVCVRACELVESFVRTMSTIRTTGFQWNFMTREHVASSNQLASLFYGPTFLHSHGDKWLLCDVRERREPHGTLVLCLVDFAVEVVPPIVGKVRGWIVTRMMQVSWYLIEFSFCRHTDNGGRLMKVTEGWLVGGLKKETRTQRWSSSSLSYVPFTFVRAGSID